MHTERSTRKSRGNRADHQSPCSSSPRRIAHVQQEHRGKTLKHLFGAVLLVGIVFVFGAIVSAAGTEHAAGPRRITPPEDRGYLAFPMRIMNRSTYDAYHFDPETDGTAIISYSVSKSGWVRVRLVRRDNKEVVLRTIQQWTESHYDNQRRYEIVWDGKDATGNRIDPRQMFVLFESRDSRHGAIHRSHPVRECVDPDLIVSTHSSAAGFSLAATLEVGPGPGRDPRGFEARVYLDGQLIDTRQFAGNTRSFDFSFAPEVFSAPAHTITVNLDDFQDHIAVARVHVHGSTHEVAAFR